MRKQQLLILFSLGILSAAAAAAARGESPDPRPAPDYLEQIKPLLISKCVSCHGPIRQEGGLRVDTASLLLEGGDSGEVVMAAEPEQSYLLDRITAEHGEDRMPPESEGEPLSAEQIELLRRWIAAGLPAPEAEQPLPPPEEHWAYQPIVRPEVPRAAGEQAGASAAAPRNPIDQFLAVAHERSGVTAAGRADAATLLRRVTMDLSGLPPRRAELAEFLADDSPEAYSHVVDRLLDSPRFGERWGRHWMDVWRYSDWDGYKNQLRGSQRHIWHWRDWIIESLNEDKGYDQMILEMIAGDELAPEDPDTLRATGFLARNYHHSNRDIWLDATVEHTAKAFLGMTIACARCHDHKYDPISQREYYAFRAIFEPHRVRSDRIPGQPDIAKDALPRAFDAEPEAPTYLYVQGDEKRPDKDDPLAPAVPAIFQRPLEIEPVSLPLRAYFPAAAEHVEQEDLAAAARRVGAAQKALDALAGSTDASDDSSDELELARLKLSAAQAAQQSLASRWEADRAKHTDRPAAEVERLAAAAAAAERQAKLQQAEWQVAEKERAAMQAEARAKAAADKESNEENDKQKADAAKLQKAAEKTTKELEAARKALVAAQTAAADESREYTAVGEAYPRQSTGRRLALARWIASRENPLTARVAVNHVWLRHFGAPLVDQVFDFGLQAPRPQHADLLDWLAADLIDSGWSLKHLHRLIVHSRAYTAASSGIAGSGSPERQQAELQRSAELDPDNRLFWRANTRRLNAEVIRDSLFFVAGSLDLTLGGPEIPASDGETVPRRSVYFQHAYEKQMTMLTLFDAASPNECYRRSESILPQQALALSNSAASLSQARKLARELSATIASAPTASAEAASAEAVDSGAARSEAGGSEPLPPREAFIRAAFEQVLARPPRNAEVRVCLEFLDRQQRLLADPTKLTASAGKGAPQLAPAEDPALRARENLLHVLLNHNDFVTLR